MQLALGRHQRVGADMPVVAEVFDAEQTIVGGLGVRQHIPGCRAIDKPLFQQKPDKLTLRQIGRASCRERV